jgi:hypothetical protein
LRARVLILYEIWGDHDHSSLWETSEEEATGGTNKDDIQWIRRFVTCNLIGVDFLLASRLLEKLCLLK